MKIMTRNTQQTTLRRSNFYDSTLKDSIYRAVGD